MRSDRSTRHEETDGACHRRAEQNLHSLASRSSRCGQHPTVPLKDTVHGFRGDHPRQLTFPRDASRSLRRVHVSTSSAGPDDGVSERLPSFTRSVVREIPNRSLACT